MSTSKRPVEQINDEHQLISDESPRIFVDFHNSDAEGRLRLNCIGTIEDLSVQKVKLQNGKLLKLYSEDLEVDGIIEYSQSENLWVAIIDWNEIKEAEKVNPLQQKLIEIEEKFKSIIEISRLDAGQDSSQHNLEVLFNEMKHLLRNTSALLSREKDISDSLFYSQFITFFGEEEAEEIWSARGWDTNMVIRDLVLVLMDDPALRQRIEQKGINFVEIINSMMKEDEFSKISAELPQTDQNSLARLHEVMCS